MFNNLIYALGITISVPGYAFATMKVLHDLCFAQTRRRARESQLAARFQTSALLLVLVQGWQMQHDAVHRESYATTVTRGQSPPQSTKTDGNSDMTT